MYDHRSIRYCRGHFVTVLVTKKENLCRFSFASVAALCVVGRFSVYSRCSVASLGLEVFVCKCSYLDYNIPLIWVYVNYYRG
jgi:hypothetical protein